MNMNTKQQKFEALNPKFQTSTSYQNSNIKTADAGGFGPLNVRILDLFRISDLGFGVSRLRRAFTIIEVMAVIVIIGILAGIVAINVVGRIDKARVISTKASLKLLHSAVIQFKFDTGRYPTEDEGLRALVEQPTDVTGWNQGGYLETTDIPKDGWGNDFVYKLYPESGKPFVIISYGANGEEGGEGYDADLYSTDAG
jgi:general secretion pathway protein G